MEYLESKADIAARTLEDRVKSLVDGYQYLDAIATDIPKSFLVKAAEHKDNLLNGTEILTSSDKTDLESQSIALEGIRKEFGEIVENKIFQDVTTKNLTSSFFKKPSSHFILNQSYMSGSKSSGFDINRIPAYVSPSIFEEFEKPAAKSSKTNIARNNQWEGQISGSLVPSVRVGVLPPEIQSLSSNLGITPSTFPPDVKKKRRKSKDNNNPLEKELKEQYESHRDSIQNLREELNHLEIRYNQDSATNSSKVQQCLENVQQDLNRHFELVSKSMATLLQHPRGGTASSYRVISPSKIRDNHPEMKDGSDDIRLGKKTGREKGESLSSQLNKYKVLKVTCKESIALESKRSASRVHWQDGDHHFGSDKKTNTYVDKDDGKDKNMKNFPEMGHTSSSLDALRSLSDFKTTALAQVLSSSSINNLSTSSDALVASPISVPSSSSSLPSPSSRSSSMQASCSPHYFDHSTPWEATTLYSSSLSKVPENVLSCNQWNSSTSILSQEGCALIQALGPLGITPWVAQGSSSSILGGGTVLCIDGAQESSSLATSSDWTISNGRNDHTDSYGSDDGDGIVIAAHDFQSANMLPTVIDDEVSSGNSGPLIEENSASNQISLLLPFPTTASKKMDGIIAFMPPSVSSLVQDKKPRTLTEQELELEDSESLSPSSMQASNFSSEMWKFLHEMLESQKASWNAQQQVITSLLSSNIKATEVAESKFNGDLVSHTKESTVNDEPPSLQEEETFVSKEDQDKVQETVVDKLDVDGTSDVLKSVVEDHQWEDVGVVHEVNESLRHQNTPTEVPTKVREDFRCSNNHENIMEEIESQEDQRVQTIFNPSSTDLVANDTCNNVVEIHEMLPFSSSIAIPIDRLEKEVEKQVEMCLSRRNMDAFNSDQDHSNPSVSAMDIALALIEGLHRMIDISVCQGISRSSLLTVGSANPVVKDGNSESIEAAKSSECPSSSSVPTPTPTPTPDSVPARSDVGRIDDQTIVNDGKKDTKDVDVPMTPFPSITTHDNTTVHNVALPSGIIISAEELKDFLKNLLHEEWKETIPEILQFLQTSDALTRRSVNVVDAIDTQESSNDIKGKGKEEEKRSNSSFDVTYLPLGRLNVERVDVPVKLAQEINVVVDHKSGKKLEKLDKDSEYHYKSQRYSVAVGDRNARNNVDSDDSDNSNNRNRNNYHNMKDVDDDDEEDEDEEDESSRNSQEFSIKKQSKIPPPIGALLYTKASTKIKRSTYATPSCQWEKEIATEIQSSERRFRQIQRSHREDSSYNLYDDSSGSQEKNAGHRSTSRRSTKPSRIPQYRKTRGFERVARNEDPILAEDSSELWYDQSPHVSVDRSSTAHPLEKAVPVSNIHSKVGDLSHRPLVSNLVPSTYSHWYGNPSQEDNDIALDPRKRPDDDHIGDGDRHHNNPHEKSGMDNSDDNSSVMEDDNRLPFRYTHRNRSSRSSTAFSLGTSCSTSSLDDNSIESSQSSIRFQGSLFNGGISHAFRPDSSLDSSLQSSVSSSSWIEESDSGISSSNFSFIAPRKDPLARSTRLKASRSRRTHKPLKLYGENDIQEQQCSSSRSNDENLIPTSAMKEIEDVEKGSKDDNISFPLKLWRP